MSWRGWLKMAFHQPLVPVLPVARELISKTKWIANKNNGQDIYASPSPQKMPRAKALTHTDNDGAESERSQSPHPRWRKSRKKTDSPTPAILPEATFTSEPEGGSRPPSRNRKFNLFGRS